MNEQLAPGTYLPQELVDFYVQFRVEHPDADVSFFPEWLCADELLMEPETPVVITEGIVRYLERGE